MRRFFAHFLFILSAWTLTIKWILPVIWAVDQGVLLTTYIWWDFWWVAHIWLGFALLYRARHLLSFVYLVSILEIGIVLTKFFFFLTEPEWTIWTMNWVVNKVFVLALFLMLLTHALFNRKLYTSSIQD